MATKSFLKNVNIHGTQQIKKFVDALEKAENIKGKEVNLNRGFQKVRQQDIKKIFGEL